MKTNFRPGGGDTGQHRHPESESRAGPRIPRREPASSQSSCIHAESPDGRSGAGLIRVLRPPPGPALTLLYAASSPPSPAFPARSGGTRPGLGERVPAGTVRWGCGEERRGRGAEAAGASGGAGRRERAAASGGGRCRARAGGGCAGPGARDTEPGRGWGPRERRGSSWRGRGAPRPRKEEDA